MLVKVFVEFRRLSHISLFKYYCQIFNEKFVEVANDIMMKEQGAPIPSHIVINNRVDTDPNPSPNILISL